MAQKELFINSVRQIRLDGQTVIPTVVLYKGKEHLVVHHSDFDVLIPSHSRIGKLSGGTRISMLLGTPG